MRVARAASRRQARLTRSTSTGQRQQAGVREQALHFGQLVRSPHKRPRRDWQRRWERGTFSRVPGPPRARAWRIELAASSAPSPVGELPHGSRVGRLAGAALEVGDPASAQASSSPQAPLAKAPQHGAAVEEGYRTFPQRLPTKSWRPFASGYCPGRGLSGLSESELRTGCVQPAPRMLRGTVRSSGMLTSYGGQ